MREKQREEARNSGLASVKVKIYEIILIILIHLINQLKVNQLKQTI